VFVLGSRFEARIYELFTLEPVTPSEVPKRVGVTYEATQRAWVHLALTKDDVAYKNSGRIHLFWEKCGGSV
jgi:hypothetical protein